jgi:hypothetical protein
MSRGQDKVRIVIEANTEAGKRIGEVLHGAFAKAGQGVDQFGQKGQRGFEGLVRGADRLILKLVGVQTAADLALRAVTAALQAQQKMREESVGPVAQMDNAIRNYLKTTGLSPEKSYAGTQRMFMATAMKYAVPFQTVGTVAEALASADIPQAVIAGGGLDAVIKGWIAMNLQGSEVNPEAHAKAIGMLLSSTGTAATPENMERVNRVLFAAKTQGNVEIAQLPNIAGVAGTLRQFGKLNLEEQLASTTMLSRRGGTEEMVTSFKNVVLAMSQFGNVPSKVQALRSAGLRPQDVDMVGETFFEAIGRIRDALANVPEERRNRILGQLVGEKTIRSIPAFFEGLGEIVDIQRGMADDAAYRRAIATAVEGPAAMERRVQLEELDAQRLGGFDVEMARRTRAAQRLKDWAGGRLGGLSKVPGFATLDKLIGDTMDQWFAGLRANTEALDKQREVNEQLLREGLPVKLKEPAESPAAIPARRQENRDPRTRFERGFMPGRGGV